MEAGHPRIPVSPNNPVTPKVSRRIRLDLLLGPPEKFFITFCYQPAGFVLPSDA